MTLKDFFKNKKIFYPVLHTIINYENTKKEYKENK